MSSPDSLDFYDGEWRAHHEHLRAAYGISPGDDVVGIGCGTELTTREAEPGRVVGVDVSERMLERARQLTARNGLWRPSRRSRKPLRAFRFAEGSNPSLSAESRTKSAICSDLDLGPSLDKAPLPSTVGGLLDACRPTSR